MSSSRKGKASSGHGGITLTTTCNGITTTNHIASSNVGSITSSIACMDFSNKENPRVPDVLYVDGVRVDTNKSDNTSSTAKIFSRIGNAHIEGIAENNEPIAIEASSDLNGNAETNVTGNVAINTISHSESNLNHAESSSPRNMM